MFVQRVISPASLLESWTVLGDDDAPVVPVERHLAHLTDIERSPNTIRAYAHDLKDWFTFLTRRGLDWREVRLADIAAAPPERRAALHAARARGQPICGRVGDLDLNEEEYSADFTPAVPFVTSSAGIAAAALTTRFLAGDPLTSMHFHFSFISYRSGRLDMNCDPGCA